MPGPRGGAAARVRAMSEELAPGNVDFAEAMLTLAWHDSGASFNLPAFKYDNRSKFLRPIDPRTNKIRGRVSAWGLFQWQDGWAQKYTGWDHAYQMTEADQVRECIKVYWSKVQEMGGDPRAAFLAHVSPAAFYEQRDLSQAMNLGSIGDGSNFSPTTRERVEIYTAAWRKRLAGPTV